MCHFESKDCTWIPFTSAIAHCRQPWFSGVYARRVRGFLLQESLLPEGLQRLGRVHSILSFVRSHISSFICPFTYSIAPTLYVLCISLPGVRAKAGDRMMISGPSGEKKETIDSSLGVAGWNPSPFRCPKPGNVLHTLVTGSVLILVFHD